MAHVNFDGLNLWITLTKQERRAIHMPEFVVGRANIADVEYVTDMWSHVRRDFGVRGIGYRRVLLWGSAYDDFGRDFCILDESERGLIIYLRKHIHTRVMLSLPPTEAWPIFARLREVVAEDARQRHIRSSG